MNDATTPDLFGLLPNKLRGKAVLITGGTDGIGLATGLAFGRLGAQVWLTHRWGSRDEAELCAQFEASGAPIPEIVEADVSNDDDTERLFAAISERHEALEVLIPNVSFAHVSQDPHDLSRKGLQRSLRYSAWPMISYMQRCHQQFGRYPRYVVAMSSRGPEYFLPGYEFVAASKAVIETFCRYLTADLQGEDVRINVLRANPVETRSLEATFGPEFAPFCKRLYDEKFFVRAEDVASAAVALCSGLLDGMRGEIVLLDNASGFADNIVRLFSHREAYGL